MAYTKDLKSFAFTGLWVRVPPSAPSFLLMSTTFKRTIEDFVCENCDKEVHGNGYTNHCPHCLFSKHMDINPGDRLSPCQGLMKPVSITNEKGEYHIIHRCILCGFEKNNKAAPEDNFDLLIKIAAGK